MKRREKKQEEKKTKFENIYKITKDIAEKGVAKVVVLCHHMGIGEVPMWCCHRHLWVDSSMGRTKKAQALGDNSMMGYMAAKKP